MMMMPMPMQPTFGMQPPMGTLFIVWHQTSLFPDVFTLRSRANTTHYTQCGTH